ncbi:hypothetical protein AKJ62_04615 [candidate division MSBL1 archaeon SCGC-AAA259D14]|uniref:EamA domain-containing protein n=1 Tax=candidate division MSBL1 archaeon SCGC-AAA259D14 TaxID=1698261 RepID=A0A133U3E2_9EURY|nr:hypothetical protein AKJ62_04615 [candidate division MSBL1 archaeon SCGC-AAA259D14]
MSLVGGVMILSYEVKSGDSEFDLNISGDLLYPIGAMAFLGTAAFFDRLGLLQGVPIPVGLSVKFLGAVTGLVLYSTFKGKAPFKQFKSSGKGSLVLAGITNSISLALLYSALSISDVVDVMPFWGISPLFGVILSYIFLKDMEKITKLVIIGAVLVMTGAILIRSFM